MGVGLVLTVWADRVMGQKNKRKLCSSACGVEQCYGFRVCELKATEDNPADPSYVLIVD